MAAQEELRAKLSKKQAIDEQLSPVRSRSESPKLGKERGLKSDKYSKISESQRKLYQFLQSQTNLRNDELLKMLESLQDQMSVFEASDEYSESKQSQPNLTLIEQNLQKVTETLQARKSTKSVEGGRKSASKASLGKPSKAEDSRIGEEEQFLTYSSNVNRTATEPDRFDKSREKSKESSFQSYLSPKKGPASRTKIQRGMYSTPSSTSAKKTQNRPATSEGKHRESVYPDTNIFQGEEGEQYSSSKRGTKQVTETPKSSGFQSADKRKARDSIYPDQKMFNEDTVQSQKPSSTRQSGSNKKSKLDESADSGKKSKTTPQKNKSSSKDQYDKNGRRIRDKARGSVYPDQEMFGEQEQVENRSKSSSVEKSSPERENEMFDISEDAEYSRSNSAEKKPASKDAVKDLRSKQPNNKDRTPSKKVASGKEQKKPKDVKRESVYAPKSMFEERDAKAGKTKHRESVYPDKKIFEEKDPKNKKRESVYPDQQMFALKDEKRAKTPHRESVYPDQRMFTEGSSRKAKTPHRESVYPDQRMFTEGDAKKSKTSKRDSVYPDKEMFALKDEKRAKTPHRESVYPDQRMFTESSDKKSKTQHRDSVYPDTRIFTEGDAKPSETSQRGSVYPDPAMFTESGVKKSKTSKRDSVYPDKGMFAEKNAKSAKKRESVYPDAGLFEIASGKQPETTQKKFDKYKQRASVYPDQAMFEQPDDDESESDSEEDQSRGSDSESIRARSESGRDRSESNNGSPGVNRDRSESSNHKDAQDSRETSTFDVSKSKLNDDDESPVAENQNVSQGSLVRKGHPAQKKPKKTPKRTKQPNNSPTKLPKKAAKREEVESSEEEQESVSPDLSQEYHTTNENKLTAPTDNETKENSYSNRNAPSSSKRQQEEGPGQDYTRERNLVIEYPTEGNEIVSFGNTPKKSYEKARRQEKEKMSRFPDENEREYPGDTDLKARRLEEQLQRMMKEKESKRSKVRIDFGEGISYLPGSTPNTLSSKEGDKRAKRQSWNTEGIVSVPTSELFKIQLFNAELREAPEESQTLKNLGNSTRHKYEDYKHKMEEENLTNQTQESFRSGTFRTHQRSASSSRSPDEDYIERSQNVSASAQKKPNLSQKQKAALSNVVKQVKTASAFKK